MQLIKKDKDNGVKYRHLRNYKFKYRCNSKKLKFEDGKWQIKKNI